MLDLRPGKYFHFRNLRSKHFEGYLEAALHGDRSGYDKVCVIELKSIDDDVQPLKQAERKWRAINGPPTGII